MTVRPRRRSRSLAGVFGVPFALAVMTLTGLVVGLAGEGLHNLIAWLLLAPLPAVLTWAWARRN
ncbi:hypothetical protein [Altererythrobacter sp. Root672]|uniref:hypothetical protein n=1 Tax=Altererythrobacter sp. Root672 TaxID=1736584 RepID=UPI0006FCC622|nr:hypothetical protein [Altererythrobacter sp. Root672]KRA84453.1 hypothetical protein ASD76_10885 [Altererythrobacter sp. Root672]